MALLHEYMANFEGGIIDEADGQEGNGDKSSFAKLGELSARPYIHIDLIGGEQEGGNAQTDPPRMYAEAA